MPASYTFMQCLNPDCGLRFPLDLDAFSGQYCPRCGQDLQACTPQLQQWKPDSMEVGGKNLHLIADNIRSAHNIGSIFRTSEAIGVKTIHLCGLTPTPETNPAVAKAVLGSEQRVNWEYAPNAVTLVRQLKEAGFQMLALECLPKAQSLFQYSSTEPKGKIGLILGSEPAGIDPALLNLADQTLYIPMCGEKSSLNVSVAFGVAVYSLFHHNIA